MVEKSGLKSEEATVKTEKSCFVFRFAGKDGEVRLRVRRMLSWGA